MALKTSPHDVAAKLDFEMMRELWGSPKCSQVAAEDSFAFRLNAITLAQTSGPLPVLSQPLNHPSPMSVICKCEAEGSVGCADRMIKSAQLDSATLSTQALKAGAAELLAPFINCRSTLQPSWIWLCVPRPLLLLQTRSHRRN